MKAFTEALVHLESNMTHIASKTPLPRNEATWTGCCWGYLKIPKETTQLTDGPPKEIYLWDELPFKSCCTFPSVTGAFHLRNPKRGKEVKLYNSFKNAPPQGQKIRTFYKAMVLLVYISFKEVYRGLQFGKSCFLYWRTVGVSLLWINNIMLCVNRQNPKSLHLEPLKSDWNMRPFNWVSSAEQSIRCIPRRKRDPLSKLNYQL